ncbi:TPA: DNA-binding protein [Escherichia coli]|uniref:helix-turn-helix transcriptional regulator n=2 Tax=Escherichia coli TaxID=562 RepID=UPI00102107E6|nr:DNA-binding protein [Escherichia coli]HCS4743088.1 DNA-binding protein [Escherichia coli]HCS4927939.1 DNA-binding protein [Escherichia coli]HCS4946002.1 DNA-binding protein [Escherichia coli]
MKMNDSDIIGIGEVAAIFGVHRQTIAKWLTNIPTFPQPFTPQVKGIHQKWYRHEIIEYINKNKGRAK